MVERGEEGMVAVSAYLTHKGVFEASEWMRFKASCEEFGANKEQGLQMPLECPFCGEVLQFPNIVVNDGGWLQVSPDGIEELESRGVELS
jgi:hypothetical protein